MADGSMHWHKIMVAIEYLANDEGLEADDVEGRFSIATERRAALLDEERVDQYITRKIAELKLAKLQNECACCQDEIDEAGEGL